MAFTKVAWFTGSCLTFVGLVVFWSAFGPLIVDTLTYYRSYQPALCETLYKSETTFSAMLNVKYKCMARVGTQTCCDESGEHAEFVFIVDSDTVRKSDKKKAWLTLNAPYLCHVKLHDCEDIAFGWEPNIAAWTFTIIGAVILALGLIFVFLACLQCCISKPRRHAQRFGLTMLVCFALVLPLSTLLPMYLATDADWSWSSEGRLAVLMTMLVVQAIALTLATFSLYCSNKPPMGYARFYAATLLAVTIPVGVVLPTIVALHLKNMLVAFVLGILLGLLALFILLGGLVAGVEHLARTRCVAVLCCLAQRRRAREQRRPGTPVPVESFLVPPSSQYYQDVKNIARASASATFTLQTRSARVRVHKCLFLLRCAAALAADPALASKSKFVVHEDISAETLRIFASLLYCDAAQVSDAAFDKTQIDGFLALVERACSLSMRNYLATFIHDNIVTKKTWVITLPPQLQLKDCLVHEFATFVCAHRKSASADYEFVCSGVRFFVHRTLLEARGLSGLFDEHEDHPGITLVSFSADVMLPLLRFVYTDMLFDPAEPAPSMEILLGVLKEVLLLRNTHLRAVTLATTIPRITRQNVGSVLQVAHAFKIPELEAACRYFIALNREFIVPPQLALIERLDAPLTVTTLAEMPPEPPSPMPPPAAAPTSSSPSLHIPGTSRSSVHPTQSTATLLLSAAPRVIPVTSSSDSLTSSGERFRRHAAANVPLAPASSASSWSSSQSDASSDATSACSRERANASESGAKTSSASSSSQRDTESSSQTRRSAHSHSSDPDSASESSS